MDMFVEGGYEVYQSIQHSASMDIGKVKEKYGDQLVVWGGIMVKHLVSGTPEDIRRDAEYAMRVAAPGGGFIFGETHSIAVGTNYDNFMALLDAYHKPGLQSRTVVLIIKYIFTVRLISSLINSNYVIAVILFSILIIYYL